MDAARVTQDALEDRVGWHLAAFLETQEKAWANYTVEFLKSLCAELGLDWMEALPEATAAAAEGDATMGL